jgi:N4-gp56 family major capsid protein
MYMSKLELLKVNLQMFDNTNVTTDGDLSPEMKIYYDKDLLRNANPKLVHNQFGQKKPIPKGKGKTIEFRKYDPLPKALTPLVDGVTPSGRKTKVTTVTATIKQYGDFIEISDMLDLTAIDNNLVENNRLLGNQAGETIDTLTREIINAGTNVQYGAGAKAARYLLAGGDATWGNNDYFNVECIRQGALNLRNSKATPVKDGDFVAILHSDSVYCLKKDIEWQEAVKYQNADKLFRGEVGKYDGVRIVETTEAKIFHALDLSAASRNLGVASVAGSIFTVDEALTADDATALVGRKLLCKGYQYSVTAAAAGAAGAATITVAEAVQGAPGAADIIYPGEAGAEGRDVYSALFIGSDAYGVTEVEGGGLKTIVKQLGSAGAADPLNQRATSGWKATHTAEILSELFMVRVEHTTPYQRGAN